MLFTPHECNLIIKCLEAYKSEIDLHTDFGGTVISSAVKKLSSITALTVFNNKEFSAMYTSLSFIEDYYEAGNLSKLPGFSGVLPKGFHRLLLKLDKLCDER